MMKKMFAGLVLMAAASLTGGAYAAFDNLTLGVPGKCDQVIEREGYALGYSEKHEQALWVQYKLTKAETLSRKASRQDNFMDDPTVKTGSATLADYAGSGYDRGHLAPAADMHWSDSAMLESFYMSNMSPQAPAFNRGVWKALEQQVRRFAYSEGEVWVATGPVFKGWNGKTIGANKVAVPPAYYKVVYSEKGGKMIGFILRNAAGDENHLKQYACSVSDVEKATGLRFFPKAKADELKKTVAVSSWIWNEDRKAARRKK